MRFQTLEPAAERGLYCHKKGTNSEEGFVMCRVLVRALVAPIVPPAATQPASRADLDGDVDIADMLIFQGCFNGPNRPPKC